MDRPTDNPSLTGRRPMLLRLWDTPSKAQHAHPAHMSDYIFHYKTSGEAPKLITAISKGVQCERVKRGGISGEGCVLKIIVEWRSCSVGIRSRYSRCSVSVVDCDRALSPRQIRSLGVG
ncbi:hypothetical protein B296_00024655 [Ensete ventricosum]|uniref:Uncharacterized protein n=1 Tax=Ensete ventricosum TaxID=4639 RepID=A0A426ZC92_ENSVE|nr:hypothetical protein B296_00024655 [Ensete ventricosum]